MSIERGRESITFVCDECDDECCVDNTDFKEAWAEAKEEGWRAEQDLDGEWSHTCRVCSEP
ncbi:hypothetical protein UFOVP1244_120 [uncultured Caudovirales phage]|uniref:Uncharacterized protein n=1 Tax=uncultured Caudovirales phage TaxID=2100421 RepID=A0A6J5RKX4_9CAUD|nr:hypothetical protein UFOVP1244_120 [uncultured Caudovirales phage]